MSDGWARLAIILCLVLVLIVMCTVSWIAWNDLKAMKAQIARIDEILESNNLTSDRFDESFEDVAEQNRLSELELLDSAVGNVRGANSYMAMYDQDNTTPVGVLLYNQSGEVVQQTNDNQVMVFMSDNTCVYFSDSGISSGTDIDVLKQVSCAIKEAKEYNKIDLKKEKENGQNSYTEYVLDVHGYDDVQKVMSRVGTEYGSQMTEAMKDSLATIQLSDGEDYKELNVRYSIALDKETNALNGVTCYYYFGNDGSVDFGEWKKCYLIWSVAYGGVIGSWKLPDSWYEFNYGNLSEDNVEILVDMLGDLDTQVSQLGSDLINDEESNLPEEYGSNEVVVGGENE